MYLDQFLVLEHQMTMSKLHLDHTHSNLQMALVGPKVQLYPGIQVQRRNRLPERKLYRSNYLLLLQKALKLLYIHLVMLMSL